MAASVRSLGACTVGESLVVGAYVACVSVVVCFRQKQVVWATLRSIGGVSALAGSRLSEGVPWSAQNLSVRCCMAAEGVCVVSGQSRCVSGKALLSY